MLDMTTKLSDYSCFYYKRSYKNPICVIKKNISKQPALIDFLEIDKPQVYTFVKINFIKFTYYSV